MSKLKDAIVEYRAATTEDIKLDCIINIRDIIHETYSNSGISEAIKRAMTLPRTKLQGRILSALSEVLGRNDGNEDLKKNVLLYKHINPAIVAEIYPGNSAALEPFRGNKYKDYAVCLNRVIYNFDNNEDLITYFEILENTLEAVQNNINPKD